jgi:fructose-1,6-bisphosphatase/inositol monophosphatase family enzyme
MTSAYSEILKRIEAAIGDARAIFARFTPGAIDLGVQSRPRSVTEADRAVTRSCARISLRRRGWLSEESVDDLSRLGKVNVWVVDPSR